MPSVHTFQAYVCVCTYVHAELPHGYPALPLGVLPANAEAELALCRGALQDIWQHTEPAASA